jgi:hypothetical protein
MMTPRTALADIWRSRLAEAEHQIAVDPTRQRWLPGIYVRVYRFLLSCYGDEAAAESFADGAADRMEFHGELREFDGAGAKPVETIRAALGAIHDARGEGAPAGPLVDGGLRDGDWIAVAAASSRVSPAACCRLLREQGLQARQTRRAGDTMVMVPGEQRERAFRLLRENRDQLRATRRRRHSLETFSLTVFSIALLCIPTVVMCHAMWNWYRLGWMDFSFPADQMLYVAAVAAGVAGLCGLLSAFSRRH